MFANLSKSWGGASTPKEPQTQNGLFVHNHLLPIVVKLQTEIRGRKYKEVQALVDDAIEAIKLFEKEEWPPSRVSLAKSGDSSDTEGGMDTVETTSSEEVDPTNPTPPVNNDAAGEAAEPPPSETDTHDVKTAATAPTLGTNDPQTQEPVHEAIEKTLEAFMAVLGHPAKVTKPCEISLDGINLLVANRYVSGRAGGQDDMSGSGANAIDLAKKEGQRPPPASLLHRLMESVAKCSESNVETIQVALIRTLKTIMTSPKCAVHESSMLLALRSTFHVYLVTKSTTCKDQARAALLDMLRSVIGRMEAYHAIAVTKTLGEPDEKGQKDGNGAPDGEPPLVTEPVDDQDAIQESPSEEIFALTSPFPSQYHADSYALFRSLCKMSSKELEAENDEDIDRSGASSFFSIQTSAASDPMSLNGKILALELILAAMDFSGEAFTQGERFIYLVQNYLCVSLLKNCMSNHTQIAFLSQKIFLVLVYKFKDHMKHEIEVFMSNVFLRVLESQNSSFKQKALVLESLRSICNDPVLLTQIFLNYDCDFEARNLYKEIVHMLTKLGGKATSAPSANLTKKDADQEFELSLAGLEVLTTILKAFLKALGLPGSEDDDPNNDTASSRIRGMLQLDIGLAAMPEDPKDGLSDSVASDDLSANAPSEASSRRSKAPNSGSAPVSTSTDVAGKIVDAFETKRNVEQNFEIGAVKFTLSLKSGLNFFVENGFVERDARAIALFFLANKDKLDKTQMGEALGREPDAAYVKGDDLDVEKGGPGFWVRILHHYVDALDFTGLQFDDAIRLFLSGFRLPGEAQKIDRIMEKFAERFTAQNPDVFPSADTAFILAFSVIMLNTDLHNPSIKPERRMTVDSFIRNNRGIGENGSDLPEDFLVGIFNRIKASPFSLKEDDAARERVGTQKAQPFEASVFFENSLFGVTTEEKRKERFKKERDEMMAMTQQLVRRRTDKKKKGAPDKSSSLADTVAPADVVKPMFDVTWGPMLGIFSQVLECSDDERSVAVCLNGFVYSVRISANSSMSLVRDTFVSSLAKFTFLGSIKEMKRKNVDSIRTLLSIAVIDGDYLDESWGPVLQCISQVARLRLAASGLDSDEAFLIDSPRVATPKRTDFFATQPTRSEVARETEESNAQAVLEAVQEVLIDKVFSSTVKISAKSLAHFIEQLIAVSSSEIAGTSKSGITGVESGQSESDNTETSSSKSSGNAGPSIFSLQKLVEVADYNMDVRPRLVWTQVWEVMAEYFAKIACHKNSRVSFFALDSLKQLSSKFLEKPELSEFNFQRIFLNPFLVVMEDEGSSDDIREMVLHCIDNIIRTKSRNLRSGWKIVFSILRRSASDPSEKIDFLGLSILQRLLDEHLEELCSLTEGSDGQVDSQEFTRAEEKTRNANVDDFVGLCRASLSFVHQEESDSARPIGLSMRAFSHTAIYADLLAGGRVLPPVSGAQSTDPQGSCYTYCGLSDEEALEMALWRPLFEGLAAGVRSSARSSAGGVGCLLQRSSILAFRAILLRHGRLFSVSQWRAILEQTLIPCIQIGARTDISPVVRITSESPSVSNIDFMVESLPLPPPQDDESLLAFKKLNTSSDRSIGPAELMLEASFSDLRHGGDGDLRKAYKLAKMDQPNTVTAEQPFPDSWVATTAPIALGLLTDIASEIVVACGESGRTVLWPLIAEQYRVWSVGQEGVSNNLIGEKDYSRSSWRPCEALVRISSREVHRFPIRLASAFPELSTEDRVCWASAVIDLFSDLILENVRREKQTLEALRSSKLRAIDDRKGDDFDGETGRSTEVVVTSFGTGTAKGRRRISFQDPGSKKELKVVTTTIKLDFGILYQPEVDLGKKNKKRSKPIPLEVSVPGAYWEAHVPELKIRSICAYGVQQSLSDLIDVFLPYASQKNVSALIESLTQSSAVADTAGSDQDVSTAFQEALFSDWGDGVEEVQQALESAARMSHLHGSGMFFFAQEAGATNTMILVLSVLYADTGQGGASWKPSYAEPYLVNTMLKVLHKFLESERRDGHLIDPNVWRNASESGGKVALYCTCFAYVVVQMLKTISAFRPDQFSKHRQEFFPVICSLVSSQSEEIRKVVSDILLRQVAPMIGVQVDLPVRESMSSETNDSGAFY